jgi:isopenicillin N synthase-like dioxygenase
MEVIYDRTAELKAFDDTKAGVKGLVDAGITQLPRIFIHPPESLDQTPNPDHPILDFPIIDLRGLGEDGIRHKEIVDRVREASENWGFFQVVNHGVEPTVLNKMINGVRRFFEQDVEVKKKWYSREQSKLVRYNSNYDLFVSPAACWRDSIGFAMVPDSPKPEEIPDVCRGIVTEYSGQVIKLGSRLLSIFSEALGLNPEYLEQSYEEGFLAGCHYYPACPQPEKTMGTIKHTDSVFFTVLLQDHIGGLQVLHRNHWVNVPPNPAALVVNIVCFE